MRARDEHGSLVIAMAVVLVLSGLSIAVLARTVSAIGSARVAQDDTAAASAADVGLTDALYSIGHGAVPDNGPFPATIGPVVGPAGSGRFSWTATAADAAHVSIRSVGTVNGRQHQLGATASRAPRWPWVVATSGSFVLTGRSSITGRIASAGPMTLGADAGQGSVQDLIGPGAACAGCQAPNVLTSPVSFPTPSVPTSPPPLPCPLTPIVAIPAGTYVCTTDITFAAGLVIGGPVVIYQRNGPSGVDAPTAIHFGGVGANSGGAPANFVIHKVGPGVIDPGEGGASGSFTGILDAPQATLDSSNCQFGVTGAVLLGSFACDGGGGGPTLTYGAGAVLAATWQIVGYHDAPVGAA